MLESIVVDVHAFKGLSGPGDHAHQVLHAPHLLDLVDLGQEIIKAKIVLGDLFLDPAGLLLVELFLGPLHQGDHVPHAQDPVCHPGGVEYIDGIHLLPRADKLDGLVHHRLDGDGRPAPGIPVQLGKHHAVEIQDFIKGLGRIDRVLPRHGIHHKEDLLGLYGIADIGDLGHHLLIHRQAAGRVDDHHVVAVCFGICNPGLRQGHRIAVLLVGVDGHADLVPHYVQLVDGRRTVHVTGHQQGVLAFLSLEEIGQLAGKGRLPGPLQTAHQDNGRTPREVDPFGIAPHQLGELVLDDLHHQLAGLQRGEHVLPDGLLLHLVGELLGDLEVYVRIEQGAADLLGGLRHVDLGDLPVPA